MPGRRSWSRAGSAPFLLVGSPRVLPVPGREVSEPGLGPLPPRTRIPSSCWCVQYLRPTQVVHGFRLSRFERVMFGMCGLRASEGCSRQASFCHRVEVCGQHKARGYGQRRLFTGHASLPRARRSNISGQSSPNAHELGVSLGQYICSISIAIGRLSPCKICGSGVLTTCEVCVTLGVREGESA